MAFRSRVLLASVLVAVGVVFAMPSAAQAFPAGQCTRGDTPGPYSDVTIAGTSVTAHLRYPCHWLDVTKSWKYGDEELYIHGTAGAILFYRGLSVWNSSRNQDVPAAQLLLQGDGNLVLYSAGYTKALWASHTTNRCAFNQTVLAMQSDGNMVLYCLDHSGAPSPSDALWSSRNGLT
jgi:hypothetical protein